MVAHRTLTPEIFVRLRFPHPKLFQGGITKKFNYKQIIKVLSSFAVIAFVLVASLTVPAHAAAWTALVPAEHIDNMHYEGNIRCVTYDFGTSAYIQYRLQGESGNFYDTKDIQIDHSVTFPAYFYIYPLGKYCTGGPPLSNVASGGIAIDVTDFRSEAVLDIYTNFTVNLDLGYDSATDAQYDNEYYHVSVAWSFNRYNASGSYLGSIDSGSTFVNLDLQDCPEYYVYDCSVGAYCPLSHPNDTVAYIVPTASVTLTCTGENDRIDVRSLSFAFDSFTLSTRTDMLLKESKTLEAIEDQLGSLNDKADTIINGDQQQQDSAQDGSENVQQNQQQMDDILAQLDDYEKMDTTSAMVAIKNFLDEDGWNDVREVIGPVIDWSHTVTIMLIVLSLINLSIILFGR